MIPKIIHYCWFSPDDVIPTSIQKQIDRWKSVMPDYEYVCWDLSRFPLGKSRWVDQACRVRKFAFAADYVRLYALYNYGGIYLDTDVDVIKPFDDFLDLPYMVGQEKTPSGIESATIGIPPRFPLIKQLLDRYDSRSFIKNDDSYDMEPIPFIIRRYIDAQYDYNVISRKDEFSYKPTDFNVFTADYFSPKRYDTGEIEITDNTYSVHNFAGSWLPQLEESASVHHSCAEKIRAWFVRHILVRKDIVLLSNSREDSRLSHKFNIRYRGPLFMAVLSDTDFEILMKDKKLFVENNLRFISRDKSKKEIAVGVFSPIALVGDTDIEVHFIDCYSREQALKSWNEGVQIMRTKSPVFLCDNTTPTRIKDYWSCVKIDFGFNRI